MKDTNFAAPAIRKRIDVVDALRGFAIMAIMLFHNIEHFDLIYFPQNLPDWLKAFDLKVWGFMDFFVAGKAYAIFALLFGFTFYLMDNKQKEKGADFRLRFMWRMFLLLLFGLFNSAFYQGDILTTYALMGVALVLVCRLNDKVVLAIAIVLLLQPVAWGDFFYILNHPEYAIANHSDYYFGQTASYMTGDSFFELVKGNLTNGKLAVYWWTWEKGRVFQAPALFMLGMLMGRRHLFSDVDKNVRLWKKVFGYSVFFVVAFIVLKGLFPRFGFSENEAEPLNLIIYSLSNFAMLMVLVSGFILLYRKKRGERILGKLNPFGRMSLTNYVMQSILGSVIYYGFGFGLYQYTGATFSVLIGLVLFLFQMSFCKWWLKSHKQGPLEFLWHKATWFKLKSR